MTPFEKCNSESAVLLASFPVQIRNDRKIVIIVRLLIFHDNPIVYTSSSSHKEPTMLGARIYRTLYLVETAGMKNAKRT